jgi:hypothetical protein
MDEAGDQYESAKTQLSLDQLYIDQGPDDLADSILSDCADTFLGLEAQMDLDKTQELQESIRPEEIS